jgi:hypothetical protein
VCHVDVVIAILAKSPGKESRNKCAVVFDRSRSEAPFVLEVACKLLGDSLDFRFLRNVWRNYGTLLSKQLKEALQSSSVARSHTPVMTEIPLDITLPDIPEGDRTSLQPPSETGYCSQLSLNGFPSITLIA